MAAASSGDPGGSARRRIPEYMDPTNKFGELTYLQLAGKDDAPLPKNPFVIGKSVELIAGGSIEGANTEAQGTRYALRVRNPAQVKKLLEMTELIDGTEVVVKAHPNLNISRCVISCYDLIDLDEKDILAGMIGQGVIRVQRITRNDGGKKINTPALILTFCKTTYPEYMKIGLLHVPTRPYFPNPMLCYGCFSYGHTRARCPGPQRCFNCSSEHQESEECDKATFCRNCKGDHRPTSRQCSVYKNEMEVIKIKIRDNLTFPEARKRVEQQKQGSYAQAAAQQSEMEKKFKNLEATMRQKDEQILKLLEAAKRKDEKLEQMFTYIQQLKQQIVDLSNDKPHHSREVRQTQQLTGPITRSRNNSPAVHEPKRGRSQKQHSANAPTTTSPERQSPPPKKITTTTTAQPRRTWPDEEIEITETPPSQHFR